MSGIHSNSECENILSSDEYKINKNNIKEYTEQLDKIITSKGKLVVYLSIFYGAIVLGGLIYFFLFK